MAADPIALGRSPAAQRLDTRSQDLRHLVIDALEGGTRGHIGAAMSLIEIMRVLYDDILSYRAEEPAWLDRDRCILSKGHGCLALYAILADKGFFPRDELKTFSRAGSILGGHPEAVLIPGVEATTGSLGHGFSIGVGMALAARMRERNARTFVVMGDGEINEGSVWEAAMCASKHRLSALTAIIDYNKIQSAGLTAEILELEPLADKWRAFGFAVAECDGHDIDALQTNLEGVPFVEGKPSVVICHTVKGKGIDFAEHDPAWHHKSGIGADLVNDLRASVVRAADA